MQIRKRNGQEAEYRREKIERVIRLAFGSVGMTDTEGEVSRLAVSIEARLRSHGGAVVAVEYIQDLVEESLMVAGHYEAAKRFILYRNERSRARAVREQLLQHFKAEIAEEAQKVRQAGGLFIIGTERHESRRIDNQLRGRAGRQGDPGESRFYLSMQDNLMRLFSSDRIVAMMDSLGLDEDTPIDAKLLSNSVENAQKNVESRNFRTRKSVLQYDDVMNTQREVIYAQRRKVLDGEDLRESILSMLRQYVDSTVADALSATGGQADAQLFEQIVDRFSGVFFPKGKLVQPDDSAQIADTIYDAALKTYELKEALYSSATMRELERVIMLRVVDEYWMDNIDAMDDLKQGIGLRAYGQHDPVIAYKEEGFEMFQAMINAIREETVRRIFLVQLRSTQEVKREKVAKETAAVGSADTVVKQQPVRNRDKKVGPNDPCPCGSGKKYKKCCRDKDIASGMES